MAKAAGPLLAALLWLAPAGMVFAQSATAAPTADNEVSTASQAAALDEARQLFKAGELDRSFAHAVVHADKGYAPALHLVGRIHLQPSYANFDPHESARLLALAAEAGYAPAQHDLAELMRRGLGLPRDALLAFRWHLNAAEQRYHMSELAIADMYARGEGVAANQQQASVWRTRARRAKSANAGPAADAKPKPRVATATAPRARTSPSPTPAAKAPAKSPARSTAKAAVHQGHHIQLGAYSSEAAARRQRGLALQQLKAISPNVRLSIDSADRHDGRGTLHRLRTQSMDLGSARFLCGKLKKRLPERGCFIVSGAP